MNFFTKIKAFFKKVFGVKTELNLEIKVEESDVQPEVVQDQNCIPTIDMAPEDDEHVPSKIIILDKAPDPIIKEVKVESVKEIKSKSRTKKEKVETQHKEVKEKKTKKKA